MEPSYCIFRGQEGGNRSELSMMNELMLCDIFQQVFIPSDFKNGITGHFSTLVSQCKGVATLNIGCFRIVPGDSSS
jgi:hypothetical protein